MNGCRWLACVSVCLATLVGTSSWVAAQPPRPVDAVEADQPSTSPAARDTPGIPITVAAPAASPVSNASADDAASAQSGLPVVLGPPPPIAPETIRRDDQGRATIRAVRLSQPLQLDGRLDEEIYLTVPPAGGFIQQLPVEGVPASEPTFLWVWFDDENVYVSLRCDNSRPDLEVASELRRDNRNILQEDSVTVVFDTFYDRRNGVFFQTNPIGAVRDQSITNGQQNNDWNTVWDVRSSRSPDGWATEMVIPFKSLRYRGAGPQVWGINIRRIVKWRNELSYLTALPASYGQSGVSQMASAATLVGLEAPPAALNIELKPYVVSTLTTNQAISTPFSNVGDVAGGLDLKYGLTSSLTADVTVNTDFAQIEEDLQQVNLTRFSLFFPEKRDFFLEGQGTFNFGGSNGRGGGDVPIMFFSRRIGLSSGQTVPVLVGGRVTGKAGAYDVGVLNIQTGDKAEADAVSTNFTTMRVKRDVFRRSFIGVIATHRTPVASGSGSNSLFGADVDFRLTDDLTILGYYATSTTPDADGASASYRGRFDYGADRYGLNVEHVLVQDGFDPAIGYVRRQDLRRSSAQARFSPRLRGNPHIRRLTWDASLDYLTNAAATRLENRSVSGRFNVEFHSSDQASFDVTREYELLPDDFEIASGVVVPAGPYEYSTVSTSYSLGQQRPVSGRVGASWGALYEGTRREASYNGRITLPGFALEPGLSLNWVNLPWGDFTAQLVSSRFIYTPSARMVVTGLVQVNPSADTVSSSVRFRWEYRPGSELFVVYSDGRSTLGSGPGLLNRSLALKITRLMRF